MCHFVFEITVQFELGRTGLRLHSATSEQKRFESSRREHSKRFEFTVHLTNQFVKKLFHIAEFDCVCERRHPLDSTIQKTPEQRLFVHAGQQFEQFQQLHAIASAQIAQ